MVIRRVATTLAIFLLTSTLGLQAQQAPGAPGGTPFWTNGNKVGVAASWGKE